MITRRAAKTQAERCFEYHATLAAGIVAVVGLIDRRAAPWVATGLGAGVALHATCLFAIPSTREALLRTTASMMEDLQQYRSVHTAEGAQEKLPAST